jgi:hypothetical protein
MLLSEMVPDYRLLSVVRRLHTGDRNGYKCVRIYGILYLYIIPKCSRFDIYRVYLFIVYLTTLSVSQTI